ncbi:thioesterase [Streptacidiphilus sp. PB12-B1b]|uniref:thioesterase II family protein n=1 Tax=Streptacidiphilus sp. PB12-B1b TaxID=2705012 RepID=UPI0015F98F6D|nr:alpha/beta fold hydrolase [Streptacidiphilus sp. PB12-B1b]QMU78297.1 thioesterase [Streptacidiphilus sp. PB12-B1b]
MTAPGRPVVLFCVPYAGGSAGVYRRWQESFGHGVEVVPVGAARRTAGDPGDPAHGVGRAAEELVRAVRERAAGRPYLLFGHSMGSLVAYEAARRTRQLGLAAPRLVVVSGRNPPHLHGHWAAEVLDLPDRQLLARLDAVGGVPEGLSPSLASTFFLPLLRADLRSALSYRPEEPPARLDAPMLVLAGRDDPLVRPEALTGWARYTSGPFTLRQHEGGHFALFGRVPELVVTLRPWTGPAAAGREAAAPVRAGGGGR